MRNDGRVRVVIAVILNEVAVERLHFTCAGCGTTWMAVFNVQHVEDGYGHQCDYYFSDGLSCPDPTAPGVTLCSACGHALVAVTGVARRASPAVTDTRPGDRGTRPSAGKSAERAAAPLLAGTTRRAT